MKSVTTRRFRARFEVLPDDIQREARRAYRLWQAKRAKRVGEG